jgi:hypothetical protein
MASSLATRKRPTPPIKTRRPGSWYAPQLTWDGDHNLRRTVERQYDYVNRTVTEITPQGTVSYQFDVAYAGSAGAAAATTGMTSRASSSIWRIRSGTPR